MLSCLYMAMFLYCPPHATYGGDLLEKGLIHRSVRLNRYEHFKFELDTPKDEAVTPEPPTVEVEQSETDTDIRKTEQPTHKLLGNFVTTHYTARCNGCTGITASGFDVRHTVYTPEGYRIVAVDPSVIPLHSLLRVTYEDGTQFTAKALDKGGAIKGYKLDFLVATSDEAYRLGRVITSVEILFETSE